MSYSTSSVPSADNSDKESTSLPEQACEIQSLMRSFLKEHTAYDVLPVSYRVIVFDTHLLVKKALNALVQNGIVSAPLWSSETQKFAGMLTVADFINLIQYYYTHSSMEDAFREIESFELAHLRNVEKKVGAPAPQLVSMDPMATLYDACHMLAESRVHRVPLLDKEPETGTEMIVSFKYTKALRQPLSELKIGTFDNVATASMSTPVIQVINMFVEQNISAVPIVDSNGVVLNVYETIDVMSIARSGRYKELDMSVGEAMEARPKDYPGVHTCTLNDTLHSIFRIIRKQRVYRLIIVDQENKLIGIVSLSNILGYLVEYKRP
ncbi:AMP-activated serine/threonine-protein kinase regulatory subunit [Rhizopus stolonifer]|uniref:AMP-activated serine/threonine-protein kinase regulatory subunit n=1 Tax=Rhizopus stolonifer TaxID=4846 RepID=A0A367KK66_RHIST|nr:AMP-activated serine/threonine-protein kinase regulatory subunit [Rhizopus stolonifer]